MKKLLLLIGLVVFLTPSLKALEKGEEYFLKSEVPGYLKSNLKSKRSPFLTFDSTDYKQIINLAQMEPLSAAERKANPKPKINIYIIMKIKNKNNEQWVRICSKKTGLNSGAAEKSQKLGDRYTYKCGWINEVDQMILTSSVYSEIEKKVRTKKEKKAEEIIVPDTPVTNSYCISSGVLKCFCKNTINLSVYYVNPIFAKNIHDVCHGSYNIAITLKEYLKYGGKLDYSNYVSSDINEYDYCEYNWEWKKWNGEIKKVTRIDHFKKGMCPANSKIITKEKYLEDREKKSNEGFGKSSYGQLLIALGCGVIREDHDECAKRYLPFYLGTATMTIEEINEIKKDTAIMSQITDAIRELNRQQNQSQNQEPTEEEKAFAQAQKQGIQSTQGFFKMYDPILEKHLNSRGWTQVNPKLEKILNSMGKSQVPVKHQKRFTIRSGNLSYNF